MNILITVSSFLLVLSLLTASILQAAISFESEKRNFVGFMNASRKVRSMLERKLYTQATKNLPKEPSLVSNWKKENTRSSPANSHRLMTPPRDMAKLNITSLLNTSLESSFLYEVAASLLHTLYGHAQFVRDYQDQNWAKQLLNTLIEKGKNQERELSFLDLMPQDPSLQLLYYKMLKGTGNYDLAKKQGYPPLSDFFILSDSDAKPIYVCFASYPLLFSLFGEEITQKIIEIEQDKAKEDGKRHTITKKELTELITAKKPKGKNLVDFEPLLSYSKKTLSLSSLNYLDEPSGVQVQISMPTRTK